MAAGCCVMWCMRYNPSQATRLLLDPLISDDSAKFQTDFGGLCIQAPENAGGLLLNVLMGTSCPCLFMEVRICFRTSFFVTQQPHHKAPNITFELGNLINRLSHHKTIAEDLNTTGS